MVLDMNNHKDIGIFLKENNINPSFQRIKVYEYLLKNRIHPTVDTIYRALSPQMPTLSKTTVYNTLNLFVEKNIVKLIVIEENETRYDAETSLHGHFKCETCGKIYDIFFKDLNIDLSPLKNFSIEEQHLYFKGICEDCLNKKSVKN